jgi:hypothetical protein
MFVKKMEDDCGAKHKDVEHATMYKIVTKLITKIVITLSNVMILL